MVHPPLPEGVAAFRDQLREAENVVYLARADFNINNYAIHENHSQLSGANTVVLRAEEAAYKDAMTEFAKGNGLKPVEPGGVPFASIVHVPPIRGYNISTDGGWTDSVRWSFDKAKRTFNGSPPRQPALAADYRTMTKNIERLWQHLMHKSPKSLFDWCSGEPVA